MNITVMRVIDVLSATAILTLVLKNATEFGTVVATIGTQVTGLYKAVTLQQ